MSTNVGRKGFLGVAKETTPGAGLAATDWAPFIQNTLHGVQQPIPDESARGVRDKNYGSVIGKEFSEGDVEFNLDYSMAGYFLSAAYGTSTPVTSNGVTTHTLSRNNSNQPYSLTLTNDRVVDRQYYRGCVVDKLELKVADAFATAKASIKGFFPRTTASGVAVTASGNLATWANYNVYFGTTPSVALTNAPTRMSDYSLVIENQADTTWRSGSNEPITIDVKEFLVSGNYTLFFENTTDRDAYYNLTKQAMAVQFLGNGIGNQQVETLTLNFYQIRLDTFVLETGLANFFAEKVKFIAEYNQSAAKTSDGTLINANANY